MKLNPFRLERYFSKYEFTAPYLLSSSDCESMEVGSLLALEPGSRDRLSALRLGYTEPLGHPELRQAIAEKYEGLTANQIIVHAGAEEAVFNFMNVLLAPGDHLIVHAPYYQSLGEVARGIGADVTEWRGDPQRAWELDIGYLKQVLTDRTKAVVINFPHNPTGFLPSRDFIHELSLLADNHNFIIFSDEVYRGLEYDRSDRLPALAERNEQAVSLGVMSKAYGLAGLRIGWIATQNKTLFRQLAAFKDYTTICNSAPSEYLATLALRHADTIIERNLQIIGDNLDRLDSFFGSHGDLFAWQRPKAGSIAFPVLLQGEIDAFCADLVDQAGVLLLPGTLYGERLNAFRIGFGRRNLPEALEVFETYLRNKK